MKLNSSKRIDVSKLPEPQQKMFFIVKNIEEVCRDLNGLIPETTYYFFGNYGSKEFYECVLELKNLIHLLDSVATDSNFLWETEEDSGPEEEESIPHPENPTSFDSEDHSLEELDISLEDYYDKFPPTEEDK